MQSGRKRRTLSRNNVPARLTTLAPSMSPSTPRRIAISRRCAATMSRLPSPRTHMRNCRGARERASSLQMARGDEAAVLRSRQAWLNGLAHKYGFKNW